MSEPESASKGRSAALGKRRPLQTKIRSAIFWFLSRVERRLRARDMEQATVIRFEPPVRSLAEFADLTGRVNWHLPRTSRSAQVSVGGVNRAWVPGPEDAPHLDESLFDDPGWLPERSAQPTHTVITRVTPSTVGTWIRKRGRVTTVDPSFAFASDEPMFELTKAFCDVRPPQPGESLKRLLSIEPRTDDRQALVVATGPSAQLVTPEAVTSGFRITCNSAVRDHDLIAQLAPQVIAFGDPVFHYGPSRYAAAFRRDLRWALESTDAVFLTTQYYCEPLLAHMPEIRERLAVMPMIGRERWRWPTTDDPSHRITGNVLTNLMLPVALALSDDVVVAGCDGRNPSEQYYWKHNASTQYTDDLMLTAFETHIGFFRYRSYEDYYNEHCQQLEEFFAMAESHGKRIRGLTPSHIPALLTRGAPDPNTSPTGLNPSLS